MDRGWLNIVGGCCGTTEEHIRAIAQMAEGKAPRRPVEQKHRAVYSGIEMIEAECRILDCLSAPRSLLVRVLYNCVAAALHMEESDHPALLG